MYKKYSMISRPQNDIQISTLPSIPGVTIWYCKITSIIQSIFTKSTYHNFQPLGNEIFKKDDFKVPFFSDTEIGMINGFKALKKQMEWISGRYLIKRFIQHNFSPDLDMDQISISYLEQGAPYWTGDPKIPLSLSHSNDYTAVACSADQKQTLGLDIEKIAKKQDIYFLRTAFTQDEI